MKKTKLFIILVITGIIIWFFWYYLNQNVFKPRAGADKVNITYSSANITAAKNENFNLGVILSAENNKKISAVDLNIKYSNGSQYLVDYLGSAQLPTNYFDETVIEATAEGVLHLVLVSKKSEANLSSSVTINLSFKAGNADGTTVIQLVPNSNQVVGTTENYEYDLNIATNPVNIIVGSGEPTASTNLVFQVRFQGIIDTPTVTTIPAKIIIKKEQTLIDEKTINFTYDGKWLGSGVFNVPPGSGYTVLIKGPKHVQKRICDQNPVEQAGAEGTYHCSDGNINITNGQTLDFSKVLLLGGDLPTQDGIVNSYDISLVRNNLGKTDSDSLAKGDINLDGRVNTQDYSAIMFTLSTRTDEE